MAIKSAGDKLNVFVPITKVDAEKGMVYGVLAAEETDRSNEIFDYAGSKPHFEKWSDGIAKATEGKSVGNLRSMHGQIAAGKFTSMVFNDAEKRIEVSAKIVDPVELNKAVEGVYTGFSIGGKYVKRWKDGDQQRYIADPYEGSLVDLPCISSATFEVIRAAGSEMRKFHTPANIPDTNIPVEPTNAEIEVRAKELAAVAKTENWMGLIPEARDALMKAAPAPAFEPANVLPLAVTAVDEKAADAAGDDAWKQVWTHPRLAGQTFEKKADLKDALSKLDATEAAAKLAAPAVDAAKALTDALDAKDPAGADAAKAAAKDDDKAKAKADQVKGDSKAKGKDVTDGEVSADDMKSKKKAVKAAVDGWNSKKTAKGKREVVRAAKALGDAGIELLPADWAIGGAAAFAKSATPELKKSVCLYGVANMVQLLAALESVEDSVESPNYWGDATEVPTTLTDRFGALVVEFGDIIAEILDLILADMADEEATEAVERGTAFGNLFKVGARNSKSDKERIRKAHDLLAEMDPEACASNEAGKAIDGGDLQKRYDEQQESFQKTIAGFADLMKDAAERIKRIEAQPMPQGTTHVLRVAEKSEGDGYAQRHAEAAKSGAMTEIAADMVRLSRGQPV